MTLVIPSVGCVSAKSSDRAPVCTGSSFSWKSVVLPSPQLMGAHRRGYLLGASFRALGRGSYSCLSSWRILGSNSPLSVPDLVLLAVPTGFQGASWRQIPLGSARSGALGCADWLPRRIFASNVPFAVTLWRRSVVACAIFGQHASKDDSGIEQSASEQLSSARRLCEAP